MKVNRQIILTSEDEELHKSFKRALRAVGNIKVDRFTEESLKNKNRIVLIATPDDINIKELIYSTIRSKYLNPIVIINYKVSPLFKKENPLFEDHPFNHLYIDVPFNLEKFVAALWDMVPISSQAIREAICGSDLGYKGYLLKLLSHDLLSEKEKCVEILGLVRDYLKDKKLSKEIEAAANKIKMQSDWPAIASKIGGKLENKIK
ncbi:MAG: hypothetical protein H8E54_10835 [Candidatus Aminicenantes bacterium]|nr:hypothetical protein [Candidatus Aminicenantes bacterium]